MIFVGLSILVMTLSTAKSEAHCHIYHVWHYPKSQHCFVALARPPKLPKPHIAERSRLVPEEQIIDIAIPPLDWDSCPEGDEKLMGIAKLRALSDVPPTDRQ
jgi:hypothetical protein